MTLDEIKAHNSSYYDEEYMEIWKSREILTIDGIKVPQYVYNGTTDEGDHNTTLFKNILNMRGYFKDKKFLDIGTCAGINNILLTQHGFNVVGIDNNIYSLNGALYTMELNDVYYKVMLGNEDSIEAMNYDVLLVNQMDYIPGFMEKIIEIMDREHSKGRMGLYFVRKYDEP